MDALDLAPLIDHTLLRADASTADVAALVAEAEALGVWSVCVAPSMLPVRLPDGSSLRVTSVCGFPSGAHSALTKAVEAAEALRLGADEIDMVIDLGAAKDGRYKAVFADIAGVRAAAPRPAVLKVIIESAALTDEEIVACCVAAVDAGADFVKTSTGFHPAGGATEHAVRLMRETVGDAAGVKASGGIRTREQALAMVAAGATRLGLSGSRAVLAGAQEQAGGSY